MKNNSAVSVIMVQLSIDLCMCIKAENKEQKHSRIYWVDAKVSADFFSFLCFKFLLKQNTINQQRIYHCYL